MFGWRPVFLDFAPQNQEKQVSIQRIFRRHRRQMGLDTTLSTEQGTYDQTD